MAMVDEERDIYSDAADLDSDTIGLHVRCEKPGTDAARVRRRSQIGRHSWPRSCRLWEGTSTQTEWGFPLRLFAIPVLRTCDAMTGLDESSAVMRSPWDVWD
eukprot:535143-Rhodomonas_salina.3